MKQIILTLYSYDELSDKAKKRALRDYADGVDDPLLQSHLGNLLKEELEERGIEYDTDSINVRYSLSHCQGDGLMFEGKLTWNGVPISIKHTGRYYHSYSKDIDMPTASERECADFENVYQAICKMVETDGYNEIEYQQSEEAFREACEANDYTFEESGKIRNSQ